MDMKCTAYVKFLIFDLTLKTKNIFMILKRRGQNFFSKNVFQIKLIDKLDNEIFCQTNLLNPFGTLIS